ncbi:MAG: hypothetical protein J6F33_03780 [Acidaminococcaceae bacterium]|nr:hypothetical protein [Acidaminococcaceae bacterium]
MNNRTRMMQKVEELLDKHIHYLEKQILKELKDPLDAMFLVARVSGKSHSEIEYIKLLKEEFQQCKLHK